MSVSNLFHVYVDWNKNGSFTDTYDDVTNDIRGSISVSYGRDSISALSPMIGGRGSFTLDNTSRRYSPRNTLSPLYGSLKPARPVLITRDVTVAGVTTTYTIFRGHTDDSGISPDPDAKTVQIGLVDSLSDFQQNTISTALFQGLRSGDAVNKILDAAGWTGARDIDTGASVFPYWWADGESAFDALQRVLASEGSPALLTMSSTGGIVFRDRSHRLIRSASTSSQTTFYGSGTTEPIMGRTFQYSEAWQNIVNNVLMQVDERASDTTNWTTVWSTTETINIPASGSTTILVKTSDPFYNALTPVSGTDYQVIIGSVSSVTLSRTSGTSLGITFTAGASATSIQGVQLRAVSVPVVRSYQITSTVSSSQTDYGQRDVPSNATPEWCNRFDVTDIAQQYTAQRAQPLPTVQVSFNCHYTQTARLTALLSRNLSDRVTVIEPETALSNDFFVETITHDINDITDHVITFGLEMVPTTPTSTFILGTSTLNSSAPLAY